jgi:threonine dehydrogenase-like Zn-dependent dehydrogenase
LVRHRQGPRRERAGAEAINYEQTDILEALPALTGGRGPDSCIDAVGMEAHGTSVLGLYDRTKQALLLESDRTNVLRVAIQTCRKGGTLSIPGVYGGLVDKIPFGAAFAKGLKFQMGQTHVHRYLRLLLDYIEQGDIDPSEIITHRVRLDDATRMYRVFRDKQEECMKVVMRP